jgi:TRIAD3 protein (E3 ubiquitin-protein ligase RNF216)
MSNQVIDLVGKGLPHDLPAARSKSRHSGAAASSADGAAFARAQPVIDLVDDSDNEGNEVQYLAQGHARKRQRVMGDHRTGRFKTDPNERDHNNNPQSAATRTGVPVVNLVAPRQPPNHAYHAPQYPPGMSEAELSVLNIFPDIEMAHLKSLLHQHSHQSDLVILHLVEHPNYKKSKKAPPPSPLVKTDASKWKYDFMSQDSFQTADHRDYNINVRLLLQNTFRFLALKAIDSILYRHKYHYAVCHDRIVAALKSGTGDEIEQYRQVDQALSGKGLRRPNEQKAALAQLAGLPVAKACVANQRKSTAFFPRDILVEEVSFVNEKLENYRRMMLTRIARNQHKQEADRAGTSLECSCCYDTYPIDDMVACREEGHLFCLECLDSYAKNKMWGDGNFGVDKETKKPLLDLVCFYGGGNDGCQSFFDRYSLTKALDPKQLKKYDELQCQLAVDQAFGDDLFACPKCGYKAAVPDGQNIFSCPVEGCRFESCRECEEAAHIPFRYVAIEVSDRL